MKTQFNKDMLLSAAASAALLLHIFHYALNDGALSTLSSR